MNEISDLRASGIILLYFDKVDYSKMKAKII